MSVATGAGGAVVSQQEYDPWGQVRAGGVSQTTLNYTGQRLDGTGLLYYHARLYDPNLGRFVSADTIVPGSDAIAMGAGGTGGGPANPQSLNRYSYVTNNPLNHTDPSGHILRVDADAGGAPGVGGGSSVSVYGGGSSATVVIESEASAANAAVLESEASAAETAAAENAVTDAAAHADALADDEVLYQYSRPPNPDGTPNGFPKDLRPGEEGMSCQIASQCGGDPVQGYRQQFNGHEPKTGDMVRETTVGDVKRWGGRVEADGYPGNPEGMPEGHGTIYSEGGNFGKPFARIWQNPRALGPR